MPIIDHNPEEPPRERERSLWPWVFVMAVTFAAVRWFTDGLDWPSVLMGAVVTFAASFWYIDFMRYRFFRSWNDPGRDRRP